MIQWIATSPCSVRSACDRYAVSVSLVADRWISTAWLLGSTPPKPGARREQATEIGGRATNDRELAMLAAQQICEDHAVQTSAPDAP